jgi:hypothetical protein
MSKVEGRDWTTALHPTSVGIPSETKVSKPKLLLERLFFVGEAEQEKNISF